MRFPIAGGRGVRQSFVPLLFLVMVGAVAVAAESAGSFPIRYEAEDQVLGQGAVVVSNDLASAGRAVALGESGSIQWAVEVPAAGRYKLWLRYRARDGDKAERLFVNGNELGLGLPMTGNEWAEISFVRSLEAGSNFIVLQKDWPRLEADYLRFDFLGRGQPHPLIEFPVASPRRNIRYLGNPAETRIFLRLGGHQLRAIKEEGRELAFQSSRCDYVDDAVQVHLAAADFRRVSAGLHRLSLEFDGGIQVPYEVEVRQKPEKCPWTIVTLDVNHGGATFMRLPSGQTLLLDTAKAEEADRVLMPFLASNHLSKLDYVIVTHYHDDHAGGLPAVRAREEIGQFWDYKSFKSGDDFEIGGGVRVKVLNAFADGSDENTRSLSLRFEYQGFVYTHGADNYGANQIRQLQQFGPEILRSHVYHANHHFHGSVDAGFLRALDPALILVSAEKAVYARGAYTTVVAEDVESYLKTANRRFRETLITYDVGHIVLRIQDGDHWTVETTPELAGIAQ